MTLEQAIRQAAETGGLRLSVTPISAGYQANLSDDGKSFRVEMGADPVIALEKVLGLRPGASGPMRQQSEPAGSVFE